jgi:hypothetical protein
LTLRRTRQFVATAVESLTLAIELFNRPSQLGRNHATVMFAAHSFEMLLKGVIFEKRRSIAFRGSERSFDLGKCVAIAETDLGIINAGDRVLLAALKEDRDIATHDVISMTEDVLWIHMRSAVTVFRKVLKTLTGQELTDLMPGRVLPVSAHPPSDVGLVVGKEIEQIRQLLSPGRRQGAEARARLLPLMPLDRAARGEAGPLTEADVTRAMRLLKRGDDWKGMLPGIVGLQLVGAVGAGESMQEIALRLDPKRGEIAVRPAAPGEDAALYREVNTFDKYNIKLSEFGAKLGLGRDEGLAIIHALGLKDDPACYYARKTKQGNIAFQGLSKTALDQARKAIDGGLDIRQASVEYRRSLREQRRS